jgi:hypothetical protein
MINDPSKLAPKEQLALYLRTLDPAATAFTFQTFDDNEKRKGGKDKLLAGIYQGMPEKHSKLTGRFDKLGQAYEAGAGVWVTVNPQNGKGRSKACTTRIRSVWCEDDNDDGNAVTRKFPIEPSMVVESSPGKRHNYFLVDGDWPVDEQGVSDFNGVLACMIANHGSCADAKDICRVLRLPGVDHRKDPSKPHPVRLLKVNGPRYPRAAIVAVFPKPIGEEYAKSASAGGGGAADSAGASWQKLFEDMLGVEDKQKFHGPCTVLAAKMMQAGTTPGAVVNILRGWMLAVKPLSGEDLSRWQSRYDEISRVVQTAEKKGMHTVRPPVTDGVVLTDFHHYRQMQSNYIFAPTGELWPGSSVNAEIDPVPLLDSKGEPVFENGKIKLGEDGKRMKGENGQWIYEQEQVFVPASEWIDKNQPAHQMTWAPGLPPIVENQLINKGGWFDKPGTRVFNLYKPPICAKGNPTGAKLWVDHIHRLYPDGAKHIIQFFAWMAQHPDVKINHCIVFGGIPGIGKDTIFAPVRYAIGPWNCYEIDPGSLLGPFTDYRRTVLLRVSESRDQGDVDKYKLHDHCKTLLATPPEVLRVNEKNLKPYFVPNVVGVVFTTNHRYDSLYLPHDDRRHYVLWSEREAMTAEQSKEYFGPIWHAYQHGTLFADVAAYLRLPEVLGDFDPNVDPEKTPAFWDMVGAQTNSEEGELSDLLDKLGRPLAVTVDMLRQHCGYGELHQWLSNNKNQRAIPHRLLACGYVQTVNPSEAKGLWSINGKRAMIYVHKATEKPADRVVVAEALVSSAGWTAKWRANKAKCPGAKPEEWLKGLI